MAAARVGISGWVYPRWRGDFYPPGLVQRRELAYAATRVTSIEINGSFYSLQAPASYVRWRDETPPDFVFAVKGGRYLTHLRRLADVGGPLATFFASGVLALGAKLGPVLWQLPPTLGFEESTLRTFLALLPHTFADAAELAARDTRLAPDRRFVTPVVEGAIRHACEVRHPSLATPAAIELFRDCGVALVVADSAGRWPRIDEVTADFVYARLHGAEELYASGYTEPALREWAERVRGWLDRGLDAYVYFDNDIKVRAPYDAQRLLELLAERRGDSDSGPPVLPQ
jgi:uncharacterized protein YecE (DUF72 family)